MFTLCLLWLWASTASAQFAYIGAAGPMPGSCVQLTPNEPYAEGIAYSTRKVDLGRDFTIALDIFLGEDDEGADGITFVLHNDPRGLEAYGTWGECMGYGRWNADVPYGNFIAPSVAVEFDTYYNPRQGDPETDHVAYLENGSSRHQDYWPPNSYLNLEDGRLHAFRFEWHMAEKSVHVYIDNQLAVNLRRDIVTNVFNNNPEVYWGFTASTGRKSNLQYFCLRQITEGPLYDVIPKKAK